MSDSKVSCPNCGQHIAFDANWAGRQINCPTCQASMTIPGMSAAPPPPPPPPRTPSAPSLPPPQPAGSRPAAQAASPPVRPVPMPSRPPGPATGGKTCGLAIASMVCGLLFCLAPLTSIAGVICGHLARGQMRRDPSLRGGGMALTGLITGYLFAGLSLVGFILMIAMPGTMPAPWKQEQQKYPTPVTGQDPSTRSPRQGSPRSSTTRPTTPRRVGGMPNQDAKLPMPANPVTGNIGPGDFTYETAKLENGWLTLRMGSGFMADAEIKIVLFSGNSEVEGKTYTVPQAERGGTTPHLHMAWQELGARKSGAMTDKYTMTLKFDKFENDQVHGSLELKTEKAPRVTLKGEFNASLK